MPAGHALLVPTQAPSDATVASLQDAVFTTVPSGRTFYHRVRKGETLASIAARYDVSAQDLKSWNAGVAAKLTPGQRLRVVSDAGPATCEEVQARPEDARRLPQGRRRQPAAAAIRPACRRHWASPGAARRPAKAS